jgi:arabinogalactan oligomer / maltooligosaccharide transport system substrate-binding protein
MKNSKKLLSLILVLTLTTLLFVGCGDNKEVDTTSTEKETSTTVTETTESTSENTTEATTEVTGLVPEEGAQLIVWESNDANGKFLEEAAKRFTNKYGVPVTYEAVELGDSADKIALDGPSGVGADVFSAPHDKLGSMMSAGLLLDNDMPGYTEDVFAGKALSATTYEGKQIGFPLSVETYLMFYNKDLMPTAPESFDDILEFSKTFNDERNNKFSLMWEVGSAYYAYAFLGAYVNLFGENGDDVTSLGVDTPEAVEAMKVFQNLRTVYNVDAADATRDAMLNAFKGGLAAAVITGPWDIEDFNNSGINYGVAPLPKLPNGIPAKSFSGTRALYVSSFTKYPVAAKLFADFCAIELAELHYEMTQSVPAISTVAITDEKQQVIYEQYENSFPMPKIPAMGSYWSPMGTAYANIWNGADIQSELNVAIAALKESIK